MKGLDGIGDADVDCRDADSKLIPSWHVGKRDASDAYWFIHDLKDRLANRVQLTSDGHWTVSEAVESAFGKPDIDYSMLVKLYGSMNPHRSALLAAKMHRGSSPENYWKARPQPGFNLLRRASKSDSADAES